MGFAHLVLVASAFSFAGIGVAFLVVPGTMAGFLELGLGSTDAVNDVRAVYGGLQLGMAAFLWLCARRSAWTAPGLTATALTFGGLFGARLFSCLIDGWPSPLGLALQGAEALGLGCALAALVLLRRTEPRPA